jgi:hypothetical protein
VRAQKTEKFVDLITAREHLKLFAGSYDVPGY